jgi:hypothetical protein
VVLQRVPLLLEELLEMMGAAAPVAEQRWSVEVVTVLVENLLAEGSPLVELLLDMLVSVATVEVEVEVE